MKKVIALLLSAAMMICLFAGCGGGNNGTPSNEDNTGEVVLEFQQWFDNEMEAGYLQSICDAFYAETGIKVNLLSQPYADTKTQLQASAVAGTMADIVALDGSWIYDYATQGNLADLGALFTEIGFDTADVSMQTTVNGTVYAQPLVIFPCLMAVNRDILTAKGINELPTTWSEFLDVCKTVTDPANNVYGFAMNTVSYTHLTLPTICSV